jgi:UDP-2,4-diacetamido-2,4,6-trideoxy-beta-L-altropyranose hydrolase
MALEAPALERRLKSESVGLIYISAKAGSTDDAVETVDLARKYHAPWIILDGYHFNSEYQRIIKGSGLRFVIIDDDGRADHYYADVVVNQNLHSGEGLYRNRESYTQLLLGVRYVLLRREFGKWREWEREIQRLASNILVTLGGADPQNNSIKVLEALQRANLPRLNVALVVGGSNPHMQRLERELLRTRVAVRLVRNVTDMAELMAWADVAVSTAGSTVWELAFMGVPTVVGISSIIEELLVSGLEEYGLFLSVGWLNRLSVDELAEAVNYLIRDESARRHMSALGRHLVNTAGCTNVVRYLLTH